MIKKISSKENKLFKKIKTLKKKSARTKTKLFVIEGKKVFFEAIDSNIEIESILVKKDFEIETINHLNIDIYILENSLFREITDMENSEGIMAICKIPEKNLSSIDDNVIILDSIRDPGNMGTIIRTAEAFGYNQVYLLNDCVDIYNSKVIRGTMGSLFRVNISDITMEEVLSLKTTHKIYSMALEHDSENIYNMTEWQKHAIIIGNEANGISKEIIEASDKKIIIPLSGNVESLNAGVAASVTMFYFNQIKTMMEKKTEDNL